MQQFVGFLFGFICRVEAAISHKTRDQQMCLLFVGFVLAETGTVHMPVEEAATLA